MRLAVLFLIAVSALGAIARVGSCSSFDDASSTPHSTYNLSPVMNVVAGNLVVIITRANVASTSVTIGGVSATSAVALGRGNFSTLWYTANTSANATATITVTGTSLTFAGAIACQYSGVAIASPLDTTAIDTGVWAGSQNIATSVPFNTSGANELIVAAGGNGPAYTAGSGYTLFATTVSLLAFEDQIAALPQTGAVATLTAGAFTNPNLLVGTFKAATTSTATSQQFIF